MNNCHVSLLNKDVLFTYTVITLFFLFYILHTLHNKVGNPTGRCQVRRNAAFSGVGA